MQDWDIWRLEELEEVVVAGTDRDSREDVSAELGLSSAVGGVGVGVGDGVVAGTGAGWFLDKDQI